MGCAKFAKMRYETAKTSLSLVLVLDLSILYFFCESQEELHSSYPPIELALFLVCQSQTRPTLLVELLKEFSSLQRSVDDIKCLALSISSISRALFHIDKILVQLRFD